MGLIIIVLVPRKKEREKRERWSKSEIRVRREKRDSQARRNVVKFEEAIFFLLDARERWSRLKISQVGGRGRLWAEVKEAADRVDSNRRRLILG